MSSAELAAIERDLVDLEHELDEHVRCAAADMAAGPHRAAVARIMQAQAALFRRLLERVAGAERSGKIEDSGGGGALSQAGTPDRAAARRAPPPPDELAAGIDRDPEPCC